MEEKRLPIGIQSFPEFNRGSYIYVDKTEHYFRLISSGKYFFLSRPRRFGKSLLLSTLKAIFEGERASFEGLWIYDKIDWEPRPVIYLDFTQISRRAHTLDEGIKLALNDIARAHGIQLTEPANPGRFLELIQGLGKDCKVAILVDEYDKPLIDHIDHLDMADQHRQTLKDFYSVIKGNDQYIAFFMLTGVSKFSQVSIFSDLNNLNDITLHPDYATMLGYTQDEIEQCFPSYLSALKAEYADTRRDVMADMKAWYNGYSWDGVSRVYNPFSILNLFSKRRFEDFWFATGTPTFLMKLIRKENYSAFDLENIEVSAWAFNKFEITNLEIKSLLFQTGYLTIKHIDKETEMVTLDFPNQEVAKAFSYHLLSALTEKGHEKTDSIVLKLHRAIVAAQMDVFIVAMRTLFADIAYPLHPESSAGLEQTERYYHSMFYLVLKLLGYRVQVEVLTNLGRIDSVISTADHVFVVEFKLGDAASAMVQIRAKGYHEKYLGTGKKIVLLGIGFDPKSRNIGDFEVQEV